MSNSACYLYHICREEDKGDLTKGYVGISKEPKVRWSAHRRGETNQHLKNAYAKYSDVIEYVVTQGTEFYCRHLEFLWRPSKKIGWNLTEGGNLPPNFQGQKRSEDFCKKITERQLGKLNHAYGKPAHNKGKSVKDYSVEPVRREGFKEWCKTTGNSFLDFREVFHSWYTKPSGIRQRTYTYHEELTNE